MAQSISLWGATYSQVPGVTLPKSTSGTATFYDVTDTTATVDSIIEGYYAHLATGELVEGEIPINDGDDISWFWVPDSRRLGIRVLSGYFDASRTKYIPEATSVVSATKGSVNNHSVDVTPTWNVSSAGYAPAESKSGTAVTVTAAELASGNLALTDNTSSAVDCTNYATVTVAVPFSTIYTSTSNPTGGSNGDVWLKTVS